MDQGLKALTRMREPKFGHFIVEFATPGIGHILKSAGCQFVIFDMEHSGFAMETVKSAIRFFEAARLPVIVRVPSKDYHYIARACDAGAHPAGKPKWPTPTVTQDVPIDTRSSRRSRMYMHTGFRGRAHSAV